MTTVAEEDVLSAVELDLAVDPIASEVAAPDANAAETPAEATAEPLFRVVKGSPSDEELAALTCVLIAAANSGAATGPSGPADLWGHPMLLHRGGTPLSPYSFPQLPYSRG